jgi:hypothetical protein
MSGFLFFFEHRRRWIFFKFLFSPGIFSASLLSSIVEVRVNAKADLPFPGNAWPAINRDSRNKN